MSIEAPRRMLAVNVLMDCIEREGVEYIFGVPGSAITPLYESLENKRGIKHILAKHEEGAAFMAGGYARVRRRLGVCCATTGPGGTNALTGIACAQADSLPVLILTGQVARRSFGKGGTQESTSFGVDLVEIFRPVTKLSAMISTAERMQETVQRAVRTALTGRPGPVHLSLPADILNQTVSAALLPPERYRPRGRPVDREAAAEAARLLVRAEHPCILAGHGVALSGAWDELLELAGRLRIPVATTPKGKSVFPETHPLSLGVWGLGGHPRAESYLLSGYVDVLLIIGTSLGELTTNGWPANLQPTGALIHSDIDPTELGKNYPIDVGVVGDASAVLREIDEQASALLAEGAQAPRSEDPLQNLREEVPRLVGTEYLTAPDVPLKPQRVIDVLRSVLPDDGLLFVDTGNCILWGNHYYESRRPHTYFLSLGLAAMGNAVAGVVGGKLGAEPGKPVVALVGDGAFAMNGLEVHTAVDHKIPVIWVVLNNHGHGMVYHGEKMIRGDHLNACTFQVPLDIAGLAAAMGAKAFKVKSPDTLRAALEEALKAHAPCVIDTLIDAEEVPYLLAGRASAISKSFENAPLSMRVPRWPK